MLIELTSSLAQTETSTMSLDISALVTIVIDTLTLPTIYSKKDQ